MKFTRLCILFAVLSVTILLIMESGVYYQGWYNCGSHSLQRSDASTAEMEELNSTRFKKRAPASPKDLMRLFDGVKTFVMFIGHGRSCHTLISSWLDAHPEIVVANEYNVMEKWKTLFDSGNDLSKKVKKYKLFSNLYSRSEKDALFGRRSPIFSNDYSYHVPGAWQGTYRKRIEVIGDKKGSSTSTLLHFEPRFFEELEKVIEIPVKLIHVVRNPFDNIATMTLRALEARDLVRNTQSKILNDSRKLDGQISRYFRMASTNKDIVERRGNTVLTLKSHEAIQRPRETIQKLCDHLMVTCYQEYVEACVKILYNQISVTRNTVVWTDEQKEKVMKKMKNYSYLEGYNFEDIP